MSFFFPVLMRVVIVAALLVLLMGVFSTYLASGVYQVLVWWNGGPCWVEAWPRSYALESGVPCWIAAWFSRWLNVWFTLLEMLGCA